MFEIVANCLRGWVGIWFEDLGGFLRRGFQRMIRKARDVSD